jgi:hypothetical protein
MGGAGEVDADNVTRDATADDTAATAAAACASRVSKHRGDAKTPRANAIPDYEEPAPPRGTAVTDSPPLMGRVTVMP